MRATALLQRQPCRLRNRFECLSSVTALAGRACAMPGEGADPFVRSTSCGRASLSLTGIQFHAREREAQRLNFSRSLLRSENFWLQNSASLRHAVRKRNDELLSGRNGMQSSETIRNSLGLN